MGKVFELISDNALKKLDDYYTECHVCEREDVDLYTYQGTVYDENGNALDDSWDSYAVCADCILAGRVTHICDFEYIKTIDHYLEMSNLTIEKKSLTRERLINKYQRTPDIPIFMQHEDRPLCCNDITEFIGHPKNDEELFAISEQNNYWEQGIKPKRESADFRKWGRPESYRDVATFQCRHCRKKYFTFQFT
ncbi:MAG: CbrC family protein [Tannerella sp.]|jgi:hypothetical protein|nr:CbrC family protein [Tannerella sp.]